MPAPIKKNRKYLFGRNVEAVKVTHDLREDPTLWTTWMQRAWAADGKTQTRLMPERQKDKGKGKLMLKRGKMTVRVQWNAYLLFYRRQIAYMSNSDAAHLKNTNP